jgi:hypothetical protein
MSSRRRIEAVGEAGVEVLAAPGEPQRRQVGIAEREVLLGPAQAGSARAAETRRDAGVGEAREREHPVLRAEQLPGRHPHHRRRPREDVHVDLDVQVDTGARTWLDMNAVELVAMRIVQTGGAIEVLVRGEVEAGLAELVVADHRDAGVEVANLPRVRGQRE